MTRDDLPLCVELLEDTVLCIPAEFVLWSLVFLFLNSELRFVAPPPLLLNILKPLLGFFKEVKFLMFVYGVLVVLMDLRFVTFELLVKVFIRYLNALATFLI